MELLNFPHISQRDGDINSTDDCVAASIAMGLQYLTGKTYTAGEVKDAVYGAPYVGGTAAEAYTSYCAAQGVDLSAINGNGQQLVAALKAEISAGHPCLLTEPDPYESGWSHVCAVFAYNDEQQTITVVDPWIDQDVTKTYAAWSDQMEFNQIWTCKKKESERTTWVSQFQQEQATATWASTTAGAISGGNVLGTSELFDKMPAYTTGIALSWQEQYMNGVNYGPPTSYEYSAVNGKPVTDWDGNPIIQQNFLGGRCEWSGNGAKWFRWG